MTYRTCGTRANRSVFRRSTLLLASGLLVGPLRASVPQVVAQASSASAHDSVARADSAVRGATRTVRFETTQGTWMNVDVSPDGRTIVFDLLGDLYTVPITGGTARRLTHGPAFDTEPVFSPDGQQIAFVSDRSGSDNLWLMDADGRHLRAFTTESTVAVTRPEWVGVGDFRLVARRGDEAWLYRLDGRGAAVEELLGAGARLGAGEVAWSRDGRFVYAIDDWLVRRVEVARGVSEPVGGRWPTALFRPALSPDGQWLVVACQRANRTGLQLINVASREQRWLIYPLPDHDNSMLRGATAAPLPRYAFTPDSKSLILATGGTLQRLELRTGKLRPIAFRAMVEQELAPRAEPAVALADTLARTPLGTHTIRDAHRDRAGARTVFSALGRIWVQDGRGPAKPLVEPSAPWPTLQREPALSPDGRTVAYVTWHDIDGGQLWRVPVTGGKPQQLTRRPGVYRHPVWSPDGTTLAVVREEEMADRRTASRIGGEVYVLPAAGGPPRRVAASAADDVPAFTPDGSAVVIVARPTSSNAGSAPAVLTVALETGEVDTIATLPAAAEQVALAPNGRSVAYTIGPAIYTAELQPLAGLPPRPVRVSQTDGLWPATRVAEAGGADLRWESDSHTLSWVRDGALVRFDLTRAVVLEVAAVPGGNGAEPSVRAIAEVMPLILPSQGVDSTRSVALEGATVITMRGDEILRNATVLVTGNRIAAVGSRDSVVLPPGVHRLDVTGTTIIPGLIDVNGEVPLARDLLEGTNIPLAANLAFGVTTVHAVPAADGAGRAAAASTQGAAVRYAELLATGTMIGARFLAGAAVTDADAAGLTSLEAARALVRRFRELGAVAIAQRAPLVRRQRQWLAAAAREAELPLIGETGELRRALTMAIDGYHTIQGTIPNAQLYDDVRRLLAAAHTIYAPTLLDATGGPPGAANGVGTAKEYFVETTDMRHDPVLRRFGLEVPQVTWRPGLVAWRLREDYHFLAVSREAAQLAARGTPVAVATAGRQQGLGVHWEMWALELGGLSAHEALRAATVRAAEALGLEHELGTVAVGKMADLVVLDADPLTDLRHSRATRYVMKGGMLFETPTLAMRWPRVTPPLLLRDTRYDPPPAASQPVANATNHVSEPMP